MVTSEPILLPGVNPHRSLGWLRSGFRMTLCAVCASVKTICYTRAENTSHRASGGSSPRPPFSRFARRAVPGWAGLPWSASEPESYKVRRIRTLERTTPKQKGMRRPWSLRRFIPTLCAVCVSVCLLLPQKRSPSKVDSNEGPSAASPGGLGGFPPGKRHSKAPIHAQYRSTYGILTGPLDLDVQSRQLWTFANDSAPSEARKRGSGGGSPRKYDDLTNRSFGPGCYHS
jgi:hypothetical protein